MDTANRAQILDRAVCISLSANTLEKGMNPTILPPDIGKIIGQNGLFSILMASSLGEGIY